MLPGMTDDYAAAVDTAAAYAREWLTGTPDRPIPPRMTAAELAAVFGGPLPPGPTGTVEVLEQLARGAEPGLMGMQSGRFYGWVIGGTLPAALGADWLTSAWDQNTALRYATPATAAIEAAAASWLLDLLDLPRGADVGFTTGATMASFTGLAAGRRQVLADRGWDSDERGLIGAPPILVLAGAERHDTIDLALRHLGLGRPALVDADDQGRIRIDALAAALDRAAGRPVILCLQAGNLHSGAYDPFPEAIALARRYGAWVHVDGAFGLWAAAAPGRRHLVAGVAGADSWATDAHKTLNVPYDCGIAVVARPEAMRAAMGVHAGYLINPAPAAGPPDPLETVPEFSRRARGVPVWAALRALGRDGVAALVERLARHARELAAGIAAVPGAAVLNDVVFTQVCAAFGDDARTEAVTAALLGSGRVWMSGSRWHGRAVTRVSVSNWATTDADVAASIDAVGAAVRQVGAPASSGTPPR
jgi:glutamate/tyrosine decarboxylase-like PLP-dependent enzyme